MDRNTGTIVLCLALGAAVMYGTTHYRINVEPVAPPGAPAPQVAHAPPGADPRLLPAEVAQPRAAEPPMRDAKVRPAGAMADTDPKIVKIEQVKDGDKLRWTFSGLPAGRVAVANSKVTITLADKHAAKALFWGRSSSTKDAKEVLETVSDGVNRATDDNRTVFTVDVTGMADANGVVKVFLWEKIGDVFSSEPAAVTLVTAGTAIPGFKIASSTNTSLPASAAVPAHSPPVTVLRNDSVPPYLRMSGIKSGAAELSFVVQPEAGPANPLKAKIRTESAGQNWDAELELPPLAFGASAQLYVRQADANNGRIRGEVAVPLQYDRLPAKIGVPMFGEPTVKAGASGTLAPAPAATPDMPAYYTNAKSFVVPLAKPRAGASVLVFASGDAPEELVPAPADMAGPSFEVRALGDGDLVVRAFGQSGALKGDEARLRFVVRTQRPVVEEVKGAAGFGQTKGAVDKIVIRFNAANPIDPKTLNPVGTSFRVYHNENPGTGNGKARTGGTRLELGVATLDPTTNSVTLNISGVVPGTYTLEIPTDTRIRDVFGNAPAQMPVVSADNLVEMPVSGTSGAAAGAGPGAALPSRTAGVTNQPGQAVDFPEYVKFRVSQDGFNPSDRVETRVMRLYYYRDAHRVAQLINRTVKSYNAATVDVRRRAADGVRDNADKAEDDRKTLEARAVRAAQDARAAEAEVANLQSGIATARNQSAGARVELLQRQQELEQARRDLARAELLTPGRTDNDIALEEQRQLLDALARDRASVSRAITGAIEPEKTRLTNQLAEIDDRVKVEKRRLDRLLAENSTRADSGADAARARVKALEVEISKLQSVSTTGDLVERANTDKLAAAQANLAGKRELEAKAVEAWQVKELQERRLRENQFRTETAALREDPDTYAPGNPNSVDAVMQVSVSVIGEGLIQLRGPIKGLNVIRTMVNQIDAPVGQVRVAVHTLQVNGERADRMEKVVANIQRYLDHSRFLTAQSAVMLRNAVTSVAARRAAEAAATLAPGCTQWDRDQKYLYSFFGKDFIDELIQLDSEFLRTGNKLLSLNSMDSTSLSAALFLMALAKNDVRIEIINEFQATVMRELPQAEWKYYMAGISQPKHCDACKDRKEYLLANNSQFQSFIGFFNSQVTGTDTLNPLQREFVKLAQIFKARMVTEMQLRQRVMERALLEERVGTEYLAELKKAKDLEDDAKKELARTRNDMNTTKDDINKQLLVLFARIAEIQNTATGLIAGSEKIEQSLGSVFNELNPNIAQADRVQNLTAIAAGLLGNPETKVVTITVDDKPRKVTLTRILRKDEKGNVVEIVYGFDPLLELSDYVAGLEKLRVYLAQFSFGGPGTDRRKAFDEYSALVASLQKTTKVPEADYLTWRRAYDIKNYIQLFKAGIDGASNGYTSDIQAMLLAFGSETFDQKKITDLFQRYSGFRKRLLEDLQGDLLKEARDIVTKLDLSLNTFLAGFSRYQSALNRAREARRPLDEKKLLDLLVDEMEDKYVEILEGTRAHTSNVDNYLKSIATALDDDFNTQYYLPSFRRAREASRYWDVTLAQIETTSVLTNNRALGKVSPAASFEFDLPKRDILITEGFKSAKALFDEYGALMNDPSFLALAKIYSGNPVSMMQGGGGGLSSVRNVLPGLPTSTDEKIMAQAGPGRREFGAALDGLIPDPAIYKFETGTGYEIRPVLSPDGQAVVFGFDYMYTTDVREPVRADEKHLGRVRRHFISTDVQLGNYELREVSKYLVSIKVARTGKGVQLLQDIPGVGVLFRPLPSAGASLQQNLIYSQATIFPTLFDLMGLRYAPAVADLDPLADRMSEFAARFRRLDVEQRVYDRGSIGVDDALRTPLGERRYDLYRPPVSLPFVHPNGTIGLGLRRFDGTLREGYDVNEAYPDSRFSPYASPEGRPKPFNNGAQPGAPGYDLPPGYGPEYGAHPGGPHPLHDPRPFMEMPKMPNANPLGAPRAYPPPMTYPTHPGANPLEQPRPLNGGAMRVPGYGSVGVGQPVPFNPAFSTTPPGQRPSSELPTTGQQTSVTPGGSPVPRPSAPTSLPPARPAQPAVPPLPTVPPGVGGSR